MNKLRGEIKVTIEDTEYTLSSNFEAIMEAEDHLGIGLPAASLRGIKGHFGLKDTVSVIYGGLIGSGIRKYTFMKLGEIIRKAGGITSDFPITAVKLMAKMCSTEEVEQAEKKPEADPSS